MGVENFIQTDTYKSLRERGQMKVLNEVYVTKLWTEALETGKHHLISNRDNMTRRAINRDLRGAYKDNHSYDKRRKNK